MIKSKLQAIPLELKGSGKMRCIFTSPIYTEANRAFAGIPFNVWEETGLKGNIPSLVSISGLSFECKLIPKGAADI